MPGYNDRSHGSGRNFYYVEVQKHEKKKEEKTKKVLLKKKLE